ncbi:DRTGG domain-containing protein [Petroclostridium sp. X23]|uniref:DRTGG domain-containing protein n=1 Tax=Petroclostridium sp. X23 TaxID=3045146 RepID=UPI0024ADF023|nr:DRTGG domain-containing protein [Petroclostridium sp. X23]WHH59218.1 DRTGG domain-containing protein [Petroclostridium sp. X23]
MKVKELVEQLGLKMIAGEGGVGKEVKGCYVCDLLSWVMSHAQKDNMWITVQTNVNIVAVAVLTEVACIVIPEDIEVDSLTIEKANMEDIPLLSASLSSFDIVQQLLQCSEFKMN